MVGEEKQIHPDLFSRNYWKLESMKRRGAADTDKINCDTRIKKTRRTVNHILRLWYNGLIPVGKISIFRIKR